MNFEELEAGDTAWLHVLDAGGAPLFDGGDPSKPVRFCMYGPGSEVAAKANAANKAAMTTRAKDNPNTQATDEDVEARLIETLVARTHSTENVSCGALAGPDAWRAIFGNPKLKYISAQVGNFMQTWANFTKRSTTTSPNTSAMQPGSTLPLGRDSAAVV